LGRPDDARIEALQASVTHLGRGLVQLVARSARVQQLLESRDLSTDPAVLHAHLDLLDAVSAAITSLGPHPASTGLALAAAQAEEALAAAGLAPVRPEPGEAYDPATMRALGDAPAAGAYVVVRAHRAGWARAGEPSITVRPAWVTVAPAPERS
jgi:molecular chaperone GrpE (heat shock protein)